MKQLTETELAWKTIVKAVRSNVRLRFSIMADRELNELLPEVEKDFLSAVMNGEAREFAIDVISRLEESL